MKLIINEMPQDVILTPEATLGETLSNVNQQMLQKDEVVSMVWIDGEQLTADQLYQWRDKPASAFQEVKVDAPHKNNLAVASLQLLLETLTADDNKRLEIVTLIHEGRADKAMAPMSNYLQQWNGLLISIESVCRLMALDYNKVEIAVPMPNTDGMESSLLSERLGSLGEKLSQIKEALEAQDVVLLGDILEYEFADMLSDWRNIITELIQRFSPAN